MSNYKVKVNNEAESREVQYLGEQLGYVRPEGYASHCKKGGYVCLGFDCDGNSEKLILMVCGFKHEDMELIKDYKEITLPQLRDMVVLKRNSIDDATHECKQDPEFKYRLINNHWHVITDNNKQWRKDSILLEEAPLFIKPIEKKEMKEYLIPQGNGKYAYTKATEKRVSDWIEIPIGMKFATVNIYGEIKFWDGYNLKPKNFKHGTVVWQRHTQPDELPFVDDEPKSLNDTNTEIKQDNINNPSHYTQGGIECIDALESATIGKQGIEAVCTANIIKYLWRYEEKNGLEDVKKAQWYLNRLIEHLEK